MASTEFLTAQTEALWQESNLDRLTWRFAKLLVEEYHVTHLAFMHVLQLRPLRWEVKELELKGESLSADELQDLGEKWRALDLRNQEYRDGMHHMVCGEHNYCFLRSGDPQKGHILVWLEAPKAVNAEKSAALEFLARQYQNIARLFDKLDQTQALVYQDELTGLFNYRYLDVCLDAEIRRAQRYQSSFCLLFIDLDNFKPVNDQHGHLSGSEVLKQVAHVLKEDLREVDSVFRYGGDEYVVLLLEATSVIGAMTAERIRKRIEQKSFRTEDGKSVNVTASIGVAACPEHGIAKETLLKMADQSMYKSKNGGKNRVFVMNREAAAEIAESHGKRTF